MATRRTKRFIAAAYSLGTVGRMDVESLTRHLPALARYPEPTVATAASAGAMEIDPRLLLVTNGGPEAIALTALSAFAAVGAQ